MCKVSEKSIKISAYIGYSAYLILIIAISIYIGITSSNTKYFNISNALISGFLAVIIGISFIPHIFGFFGAIFLHKSLTIYFIVSSKIATLISLILSFILISASTVRISYSDTDCIDSKSKISYDLNPLTQKNYVYPIDVFIIKADQSLCSAACPCKITNNNINLASFRNTTSGITRFQGCNIAIQNDAYKTYTDYSLKSNTQSSYYSLENIYLGLNFLETTLNCVGFCTSNYSDGTNKTRNLNKFLFSDVNYGTPSSTCRVAATNSILEACGTAGGLGIFISIFNIILMVLGYIACCNIPNLKANDPENKIEIGQQQDNPQINKPQFDQPQFNQPAPPQNNNPNIDYNELKKKTNQADLRI